MRKTTICWILGVGYWTFFPFAARASALLFGFFFFIIHHSSFCIASDPPAASLPQAMRAGWPQLQCNPQRTGYTAEGVAPPLEVAWSHAFAPDELVSDHVQAITLQGSVFVGTKMGNLYAFDEKTGATNWVFRTGSMIWHAAGAESGRVFFGAMNGGVYAVDVKTGEQVWRFDTGSGFSTAPLLAQGRVYMANRRGIMYCLDQRTGEKRWEFYGGAPVFQTAAYDAGRVFYGDEDMYMYCLDAGTGEQVWRSEQLYGQSLGIYHPVVYKGFVITRTLPVYCDRLETPPFAWDSPIREDKQRGVTKLCATEQRYREFIEETGSPPPEFFEKQALLIDYQRQYPQGRDIFILRADTGEEAFIPPLFRLFSLCGPVAPAAVDRDGFLIVPLLMGEYRWGRYDIEKNLIMEALVPPIRGNEDESINPSCGGQFIYIYHVWECDAADQAIYDLDNRTVTQVPIGSNAFRGKRVPQWWRASNSSNNAASISNGNIYHITANTIGAYKTRAQGEK